MRVGPIKYAAAWGHAMPVTRVPLWALDALLAIAVICLLAPPVSSRDTHTLIFALLLVPNIVLGTWGLANRVKHARKPISISTTIDVPPKQNWMISGALVVALLAPVLWIALRLINLL